MRFICLAVLAAAVAFSGSARAQQISAGEVSYLVACFYECKPGPDIDTGGTPVGTWQELTTLMIAQTNDVGSCARTFYFDGNENVIGISNIGLSAFDLDELNVCHTLDAALPTVPEAGLVVLGMMTPPSPSTGPPGFPDPLSGNGYVWGKNVIGKFRVDNPEPFQGRADAVGKYECRVIPLSSTYFGFNSLQLKSAGAPVIPAIRIEQTGEPDTECGP